MSAILDRTEPASAHRPVIFIGLDGAEPHLLRRWMDAGTLPVLAGLRHDGICADVETPQGFGDGATWPSLVTGLNPARHGRYFRSQFKPRSYRRTLFSTDSDLTAEPFWAALGRAGHRVAILDVPYGRLEHEVNGLLLVDWLIHDRYGEVRSWPPGFATEVVERLGDDPLGGNSDRVPKDTAGLERLCDCLMQRVRMKEALVRETLAGQSWDLVASVFTEPHDLGHTAWHLHDPGHPKHDAEWLRRRGDPLKALYAEIDRAIGGILASAPANATIVVFAGLGMGPDYTANGVMNAILARLDNRRVHVPMRISKGLKRAGFPKTAARLAAKIDVALEMLSLSRSRFFAMPHNENSGAIRINLRGREPTGRVPTGEYDTVCDELTRAFMEITNCATGKPIVEKVVRVRHEFRGEHTDSMPDLFVVWSREAPFTAIESPRIGRLDDVVSWGRTGDHSPNALLVARRAGMTPRSLRRKPTIVDVAPTIAALLGVTLSGVDGHPIDDLCG
jgi:predicted AlkP superfamily phosphohydrolase/phosphomutase